MDPLLTPVAKIAEGLAGKAIVSQVKGYIERFAGTRRARAFLYQIVPWPGYDPQPLKRDSKITDLFYPAYLTSNLEKTSPELALAQFNLFSARFMVGETVEDSEWLKGIPKAAAVFDAYLRHDRFRPEDLLGSAILLLDRLRFCSCGSLKNAFSNPAIEPELRWILNEAILAACDRIRFHDVVISGTGVWSSDLSRLRSESRPQAEAMLGRYLHVLDMVLLRLLQAGIVLPELDSVSSKMWSNPIVNVLPELQDYDLVAYVQTAIYCAKRFIWHGCIDSAVDLLEQTRCSVSEMDSRNTLDHHPYAKSALSGSARTADFTTDLAYGNLFQTLGKIYLLMYYLVPEKTGVTLRKAVKNIRLATYFYRQARPRMILVDGHVLALEAAVAFCKGDRESAGQKAIEAKRAYVFCADGGNTARMHTFIQLLDNGDDLSREAFSSIFLS